MTCPWWAGAVPSVPPETARGASLSTHAWYCILKGGMLLDSEFWIRGKTENEKGVICIFGVSPLQKRHYVYYRLVVLHCDVVFVVVVVIHVL